MSTQRFNLDERDNSPGTWLLAAISALFIIALILWSVTDDVGQPPNMRLANMDASSGAPSMHGVSQPTPSGEATLVPALVSSANAGEQGGPATGH